MQPPVAKRVRTTIERHGVTVVDEWAWLRNRDDPDTLAYLEAENAYADEWFDDVTDLREAIFGEIKARTQETDLTVPVRLGPWSYYHRTVEGLAYPIHCRRPADEAGDESAPEQVLLDENAEAEGHEFFEVGAFDVSPNHGLLAWSHDFDGSEVYTMRVRDLGTGQERPDVIERTYYGTAWSADERFLFYIRPDAAMRPFQIWRHELGRPAEEDVLVLEELDERFFLGVELSRSREWILLSAGSHTTSEAWVLAADDPTGVPRPVAGRRDGHEYGVDHWGDRFVILTNDGAEDFRIVTAPLADPSEANWTELVPPRPGTRLGSADAFAGHLVVHEWGNATPRLRLVFADGTERVLAFDEEVHTVDLGGNPDYEATTVRYQYQSLVTPPTVIEEDVATGQREVLKRQPVLGDVDLSRYRSGREWAVASDGERVPVDLVWHADTPIDGTAPALLYGYGSYEASIPPTFSVARLSLLDRGAVWALAHPRGGGELGRRWYREGKLLNKRNTFTDTIAVAEQLVATGYAAAGRLALRGASAGGLLVGACLNLRPDLFAAAVAQVPFVDVVNTMSDASLPLTVIEWEEWGNPADPVAGEYMASYAPYENVSAAAYPALYVTAGLNDPRVSYHEPAKWVAKLRACTDGLQAQPILLRTELGAGHAGPSGRYEGWRDEARTLAFVLRSLGAA